MEPILIFDKVCKKYHLGAGHSGFRDLFFFLDRRSFGEELSVHNEFWALKDVSFEIHPGEVLGILGQNGAGKTTILKLISKVSRPTSGKIAVNARISALIELGAGFHPDLTGRENIYLNGVILGLSQKEITKKFDHIVSFSELEQFIDTPVKRYSSGMYARLGFSVAAHADPDLLLVDEVLAVGDGAFQQKCFDFISDYVRTGKTAVFVSHNLFVIEQLCNRVILLDHGKIKMIGKPAEVLPYYLDQIDKFQLEQKTDNESSYGDSTIKINKVSISNGNGREEGVFSPGEELIVRIEYYTSRKILYPHFVLGVSGPNDQSPIFMASMLIDQKAPEFIQGKGAISCTFKYLKLTPKVYQVFGEIWDEDQSHSLLSWQKIGAFRVVDEKAIKLGKGGLRHIRADAPVSVEYDWSFH